MHNLSKLLKFAPKYCKSQFPLFQTFSEKLLFSKASAIKKLIFHYYPKFKNGKLKLLSISLILLAQTKNVDNISDEEMSRNVEEFESKLVKDKSNSYSLTKSNLINKMNEFGQGWENVMDTREIKLWRRKYPGNDDTFEYRVCGSYTDISAKAFMFTQMDLAYRKKWDDMVILLNIIFTEEETKTEIIRWVSYYPYPLSNREYIFMRRFLIDSANGRAIIVSRAIENFRNLEKILSDDSSTISITRVTEYVSKMFIQAHTNYEEPGMDYFLIYYDNPKAKIPRAAMKWASASGVPSFIKKLHDAALKNQNSK